MEDKSVDELKEIVLKRSDKKTYDVIKNLDLTKEEWEKIIVANKIKEKPIMKLTTGSKDSDWKIFNFLSDYDLLQLCMVNSEMSKLCKDEEFWRFRSLSKYPEETKNWKSVYKTLKETHTSSVPRMWKQINVISGNFDVIHLKKSDLIDKDHKKNVKKGDVIATFDFEGDTSSWIHIVSRVSGENITAALVRFTTNGDEIIFPSAVLENHLPEYGKLFIKNSMNYDHVNSLIIHLDGVKYSTTDGLNFIKL